MERHRHVDSGAAGSDRWRTAALSGRETVSQVRAGLEPMNIDAARAVATARAMFQSMVARWAMDVIRLERIGGVTPGWRLIGADEDEENDARGRSQAA